MLSVMSPNTDIKSPKHVAEIIATIMDQGHFGTRGCNYRAQSAKISLAYEYISQSEYACICAEQECISDNPVCKIGSIKTEGCDQTVKNQSDERITNLHQHEFFCLKCRTSSFMIKICLIKKSSTHYATSNVADIRTRLSIL